MTLLQNSFRIGIDEGTESTHGWYFTENLAPVSFGVNITFLFRVLCQAAGGVAHSNIDWQFVYDHNFGAFINITTTSSIVKAVPSVAFNTGDNCTNRLTGGTGTFESTAAGCTETGLAGGLNCDLVANGFTETECSMQIVGSDVVNGDVIRLRVKQEGLVMDAYNQYAHINVVKGGSSPQLRIQTPAMMSLLMR